LGEDATSFTPFLNATKITGVCLTRTPLTLHPAVSHGLATLAAKAKTYC